MSLFTLLPLEIQAIIHNELPTFDKVTMKLTSKHYSNIFKNFLLKSSFVNTISSLGYLELLKLSNPFITQLYP